MKKKAAKTVRQTSKKATVRKAAAPQVPTGAPAAAQDAEDIYRPLLQKHWQALTRMYLLFEHLSPLLEFDVDSGRISAYGAEYLDRLSDRTRADAKRRYRRAVDEGALFVFVCDGTRRVLRSYWFDSAAGPPTPGDRSGARGREAFYGAWAALHDIYARQRRRHENPDSGHLSAMWAADATPGRIEGTAPLREIEQVFAICLRSADAQRLHGMTLDEGAQLLLELHDQQQGRRPHQGA